MNLIKKKMDEGKPVLNIWMNEASAYRVEAIAKLPIESVAVDWQHGFQGYDSVLQGLLGLKNTNITPVVRVAWNCPDQIMKSLDAGALAIICPMINTAKEAEEFVSSLYYAPKGTRSYGPIRAGMVYDKYFEQANEEIIGFGMIETKQAVENIDEILQVEGLNGIFIGPSDLGLSYGYRPRFDSKEQEVNEVIDYILQKAKEYKVYAGIFTDRTDYALQMIEKGFQFVTVASDIAAMMRGLKTVVDPIVEKLK